MKPVALLCGWLLCASALAADFRQADGKIKADLEAGIKSLAAVREEIQAAQVPLARELARLEEQMITARREYDAVLRIRDSRTLDVSNLKSEIKAREDQSKYVGNLLDEYIRNLEPRLHICELPRFRESAEKARQAAESSNMPPAQRFLDRFAMVEQSVARIGDVLGGHVFTGAAVDPGGFVVKGRFILAGPVAWFISDDLKMGGIVEQRLGKPDPVVAPVEPAALRQIAKIAESGSGVLPLDVTGGNAGKIQQTKESLVEHIRKGGLTMVPILGLAAVAFIVAIFKWIQLAGMRGAQREVILRILNHLAEGRGVTARREVREIKGPMGEMLAAGIEHVWEPREMVEEVLFEQVLYAKSRLTKLLPFVAVTASAAPLLGLLGTVTGMINTFKMITIFGTGDAQTLSGGISEALITTEWGLIVAIPSLLIYAYLSRKARGIIDDMEKIAVSFLNRLPAMAEAARKGEEKSGAETSRRAAEGAPSLAAPAGAAGQGAS
jgi:biopolymer transport protein ExbB